MTALPLLALLALQQPTFDQDKLNPGLRLSDAMYLKVWQRGYEDAQRGVRADLFLSLFKGTLGKPTGPLGEEGASIIWLRSPEDTFYWDGYQSGKGKRSDEDTQRSKETALSVIKMGRQTISFQGYLKALPVFAGKGKVNKPADPNEFRDVRVTLKVGARVFQPQQQPGELPFAARNLRIDFDALSASSSYLPSKSAVGIGTPPPTNYYTKEHAEGFEYYEGQFVVTFDLFDADGTPRIAKGYDQISLVVYNGPYDREVTFDLRQLLKLHQ